MTDATKPYPVALSRLLATRFTRSRTSKTRVKGAPMTHTGYKVTDPWEPDHILVQWVLGEGYRLALPDRRLALQQEELAKIQEFLEAQNYPVKRSAFLGPGGPEGWNQLSVFGKNTSPK